MTPSREQFSALFPTDSARVAAVYVETPPTSPLDLEPNLMTRAEPSPLLRLSAASPLSPPPSPSPMSPSPPAPPAPLPWWVVQSRLPPRPRSNASARAAGSPGHWAYEVLDARPGTVLLAKEADPRRPYFDDAVVLLVHTCHCHPNIFGIILSSKPTQMSVGQTMCPLARSRYPSFVNERVRMGGPAGPHYTMLHNASLAGDVSLAPGLRVGGSLAQAQARVDAHTLEASEVLFFSGYAAWPLARLEEEVAEGRWSIASASSALLLDRVRAGTLSATALAAIMQ